jgi:hypothetical protein
MKRTILHPIAWLALALMTACDPSTAVEDASGLGLEEAPLVVRCASSRASTTEGWQKGAHILVNATGALEMENVLFAWHDGLWLMAANSDYRRVSGEDSLTVSVTYPALTAYDASTLYDAEGRLTDVALGQGRFAADQTVALTLNHLFARVTVEVDESARPLLTTLGLTVPAQVTALNPVTGAFTLDRSATVTSQLQADGAEEYTFVVPSGEILPLQLTGTTSTGETFTQDLNRTLLTAGMEYRCYLAESATAKGIHDAKEFIEFTQLYNKDRAAAVERFGMEREEGVVFRVLADIDFTGEDVNGLEELGTTDQPFSDVLDGLHHTMSNLTLPSDSHGLVRKGSEESVVRNLVLKKVKSTVPSSSVEGYYGLLVGSMYGRIEGCTLTDCEISSDSGKHYLGMLAGSLRGLAVNCNVEGCSATGGHYLGTIGALLNGKMVNCRIENLTLYNATYQAAVCGVSQSSGEEVPSIRNCFIHAYQSTGSGSKRGVISGYTRGLEVISCFYPKDASDDLFAKTYGEVSQSDVLKYSTSSFRVYGEDGKIITTLVDTKLNQWITQQGGTYEGIALFTWSYDSATSTLQLK